MAWTFSVPITGVDGVQVRVRLTTQRSMAWRSTKNSPPPLAQPTGALGRCGQAAGEMETSWSMVVVSIFAPDALAWAMTWAAVGAAGSRPSAAVGWVGLEGGLPRHPEAAIRSTASRATDARTDGSRWKGHTGFADRKSVV